jgi:hypothetical protein
MLRDKFFIHPACLEIGKNGAEFSKQTNTMIRGDMIANAYQLSRTHG